MPRYEIKPELCDSGFFIHLTTVVSLIKYILIRAEQKSRPVINGA